MPNIDIPVPVDLQKLFQLPPCEEIKLPLPSPISIQLPSGGSLKAFTDISKGIPTDCSMTFNLLVQIAPLLASMECLVKILKLLKPLIDVINGLPVPPVKAIQEFAKAAADLVPCFLIPTPANMIPFIRDILCLILKVLNCFLGQLKTIVGMMQGLTLQLNAARASGNTELQSVIECAQENAQISAQHLTKSIEPIGVLLELVGPFMGIAGVQPIQLPALGDQTDLQALQQALQTMQGVVGSIQVVVDTLGGCPA
jgi:hypothetical protein